MQEKIIQLFSSIKDFRVKRSRAHELVNILLIALFATMTSKVGWHAIANYGKANKEELEKIIKLPNGIPSHDTFRRVISNINIDDLIDCFNKCIMVLSGIKECAISIDGKSICGSSIPSKEVRALNIVSAFVGPLKLVLAQIKVDDKSNEITAVANLLDKLDVANCILTLDAMHCQRETCEKIIKHENDYVIAVKENQKGLHRMIKIGFKKKASNTRLMRPMKRIAGA